MTTSMDLSQESYTIAGGEPGKRRLNLLAEIFRPTTLRLLTDAGLRSGDRCLDLGCGGGHVALDMARIVGPGGSVTGTDFDPRIVELARQDAQHAGVGNVHYQVADARVFGGGPYDLVYARFLLSHLGEPEKVLAHVRQLVRPGGRIVLEDIDMSGSYCHPHDPAHTRYAELYTEAVRRNGGDADLGRRLPSIARAAGLRDVHCNVFQPVYTDGRHKQLTVVTMDKIRPAVLRHGLASDKEIDSILYRMDAFIQDPTTLVAFPRIVQVWGTA
jgi:2-polyprenyl-3-methyl-5-hydroxy-6-metoxy-1,4-benzoquinol methylase